MKKWKKIILFMAAAACLTGCGDQTGSNKAAGNMQSYVDQALEQQMQNAAGTTQEKTDTATTEKTDAADGEEKTETAAATGDVDYDLTNMNSDMVYSTVYQMMNDPQSYVGKTVRMNGAYIVNYWESTDTYYHCVLIKDAQACCSQGMEFVWDDGSHVYPDDYPEENAEVLVTGTFETYQETGDENLYCRLKNATLQLQ